MKLRKLNLIALAILPTITTVAVSCGNSENKTKELDALKAYVNENKVEALLSGVTIVATEDEAKPENVEEGKKVILQSDVDAYKVTWQTANGVTEESKAKEAKTALENAVTVLKGKIVTGTKVTTPTTEIDTLKAYLPTVSVGKLKEAGQLLDSTKVEIVESLPGADTYEIGTFKVLKSDVEAYGAVWNDANGSGVTNDQAAAKQQAVKDALEALKTKLVEGTKTE
ncbi:Uncharacterised protein [Mycoplasmopsis californica]|uniref:Lipoprotein n=1 Tax=Mycoplasmopsis equigenitalium TaxID=114883 RepID=A0ABY5J4P9_9BACT|nr:hypothetical protein [Mycoplasmopsis equigenitalium]UUD36940.1 hypothetical protein NPA09_03510 [Mycoplasmopsis equigenitalium]VEU69765.1 Uncharacterised protein [Mycoplasmopsis californica]